MGAQGDSTHVVSGVELGPCELEHSGNSASAEWSEISFPMVKPRCELGATMQAAVMWVPRVAETPYTQEARRGDIEIGMPS